MLGKPVHFGILGPLEVKAGATLVPLRRNRQLIVLAMLLLHANRPVSLDLLVDALWPDDPPRTAISQVQTCIWSLRRMLTDTAGAHDPIDTNAAGYVLYVPEGHLDTDVFEAHVRASEEAVRLSDRASAAGAGRRALATVRGVVLAEIDRPAVQALAAKWEERRLLVLEQCIELELDDGRFAALIPELATLTRQYPLRERMREQYMRALYGNGQRAEALLAYRTGRHVVASQLGLEPSAVLQSLHRRILSGEPATP